MLQVAAKNAVSNGSAAIENGTGVVSFGNGNGATGTVSSTSLDMTKDFCASWVAPEQGIVQALGLIASSDLFWYN